eukprot:CAMPEP_0119153066 /NCGR_PEP_ID=MMETSP1310-20130426/48682_1 /TAXON_ID=464262 /ORGANISM="Genus nov. species nov., Strain RCC2339" /LENGTH=610 /DNA_ID=CAMNT_0007145487 /DNA_START=46 /DNA_END=1878 /DNA_ORIENTATION=-
MGLEMTRLQVRHVGVVVALCLLVVFECEGSKRANPKKHVGRSYLNDVFIQDLDATFAVKDIILQAGAIAHENGHSIIMPVHLYEALITYDGREHIRTKIAEVITEKKLTSLLGHMERFASKAVAGVPTPLAAKRQPQIGTQAKKIILRSQTIANDHGETTIAYRRLLEALLEVGALVRLNNRAGISQAHFTPILGEMHVHDDEAKYLDEEDHQTTQLSEFAADVGIRILRDLPDFSVLLLGGEPIASPMFGIAHLMQVTTDKKWKAEVAALLEKNHSTIFLPYLAHEEWTTAYRQTLPGNFHIPAEGPLLLGSEAPEELAASENAEDEIESEGAGQEGESGFGDDEEEESTKSRKFTILELVNENIKDWHVFVSNHPILLHPDKSLHKALSELESQYDLVPQGFLFALTPQSPRPADGSAAAALIVRLAEQWTEAHARGLEGITKEILAHATTKDAALVNVLWNSFRLLHKLVISKTRLWGLHDSTAMDAMIHHLEEVHAQFGDAVPLDLSHLLAYSYIKYMYLDIDEPGMVLPQQERFEKYADKLEKVIDNYIAHPGFEAEPVVERDFMQNFKEFLGITRGALEQESRKKEKARKAAGNKPKWAYRDEL